MNIGKILLSEHSRAVTLKVVRFTGSSQQRFDELMKCFFSNDKLLAQRAAWAVGYCGIQQPQLVKKHLKRMVKHLHHTVHDAIKRNTLRVMGEVDIPRSMLGEVFETCMKLFLNRKESIAVRVFSMTVCVNIALAEPELKREILLVMEEELPYGSAAMRARAKKERKRLGAFHN